MRSDLPSAWGRVTAFWWLLALLLWSLRNDAIEESAHAIHLPLHHPVTALNAAPVALRVLSHWTLPSLLSIGAAFAAGIGIAWMAAVLLRRKAMRRSKPAGGWRGIRVSLGELPKPDWAPPPALPLLTLTVDSLPETAPVYRRLLVEALSYLAAHPDAYVGPGHSGSLLDHTLNVINMLYQTGADGTHALEDPLLPALAAAHDAGKVLAWRKTASGEWRKRGEHDDWGGLIVSQLPSFLDLPSPEQRILALALRYGHKPRRIPHLPPEDARRLTLLQSALSGADRAATAAEKRHVLTSLDKPAVLEAAFMDALAVVPFQSPGAKHGLAAVGWRRDARVFLLEEGLRKAVLRELAPDVAAAYGGTYRAPGRVAPITRDLLAMFAAKGWLLAEHDGMAAEPALWNMRSGTIDFAGVIVLDLPEDLLAKLPANAPFKITLGRPLFGGEPSDTDVDDGDSLPPEAPPKRASKRTRQKAAPAPAQTAQDAAPAEPANTETSSPSRSADGVDPPPEPDTAQTHPTDSASDATPDEDASAKASRRLAAMIGRPIG